MVRYRLKKCPLVLISEEVADRINLASVKKRARLFMSRDNGGIAPQRKTRNSDLTRIDRGWFSLVKNILSIQVQVAERPGRVSLRMDSPWGDWNPDKTGTWMANNYLDIPVNQVANRMLQRNSTSVANLDNLFIEPDDWCAGWGLVGNQGNAENRQTVMAGQLL
jgi:hypothetical protein